MKKSILFFTLFFIFLNSYSQTIFGIWESRDEKTNKIDSFIEVYKKGRKAYAKVIDIVDKNGQNTVCDKCKGENKNKPILGMNILYGLTKKESEWSDGEILDPRNGKKYTCYIKLVGKNKLKIRGYIGFALFGRTTYWYRKK